MSERDPFQERLQDARRKRQQDQARREAQTAAGEIRAAAAEKATQAVEQERIRLLHEGTDPHTIFTPEEVDLCDGFLRYMYARNYPGVVQLRDGYEPQPKRHRSPGGSWWLLRRVLEGVLEHDEPDEESGKWNGRGYPIGAVNNEFWQQQNKLNLFLCTDGMLRAQIGDSPTLYASLSGEDEYQTGVMHIFKEKYEERVLDPGWSGPESYELTRQHSVLVGMEIGDVLISIAENPGRGGRLY